MTNGEYILVAENGEKIQIWGSPGFVGPIKIDRIDDYTVKVTPVYENTAIRTVEDQQVSIPTPIGGSLIYPQIEIETIQTERSVVKLQLVEVIMLKMI